MPNSVSNTTHPVCDASFIGPILRRIKMMDVMVFLIPATQFFELKIVGRLFLSDMFLALILPILLLDYGQRLRARLPLIFILLALLWLFGQVATDIVRATVFSDYVRGWAKIGFTLINFCALYLLLYGYQHRLTLYAIGLATGGLISYFVNPSPYAVDYPWKFGYGAPITWLLILLVVGIIKHRRMGPYIASGMLVGAATLNIFMGFRSLGGICFLAASYIFLQVHWGERLACVRTWQRQAFLIGLVLAASGVAVFKMYDYSARSGLLGKDAQELYESQAYGEYGLLLGGRSEVLVSSRAILDSPFLGHGSWAKDDQYSSLLIVLRRQAGYVGGADDEEDLIPTHSHLLGAWVEAGLLGVIFWVWVLSLPVRVLLRPNREIDCMTPLTAFVAFLLIWDIFFSPYGAGLRFMTPYYVVFMMANLGGYRGIFTTEVNR